MRRQYVISPGILQLEAASVFDKFQRYPDSPFADSYDFVAERKLLVDLLDQVSVPVTHVDYMRWCEYKQHEQVLTDYLRGLHTKGRKPVINLAEVLVFPNEDAQYAYIGRLKNATDDFIEIATPQAYRMWNGKKIRKSPNQSFPGIMDAIRCMRQLIGISRNNNPYADVALIEIEAQINDTLTHLDDQQAKINLLFEKQRALNINLNLMSNSDPVRIDLEFRHPYGHLLIRVLATFDLFVRTATTLQLKAVIKPQECRDLIAFVSGKVRTLTEFIQREWRKVDAVKLLRRDMLLEDNEQLNAPIVELLKLGYPQIPADILGYERKPEYFLFHSPYNEQTTADMMQQARKLGFVAE